MSVCMNTERDFGKCSQAGFSLIELMVASAIGLMIMAAILTLYLNVTRTNDEMAKTNVMVENGRFAIQILQDDIAHAGFWDGFIPDYDDLSLKVGETPVDTFTSIPTPCLNYASSWSDGHKKRRLGIVIQAYGARPSNCDGLLPNYKDNTDILIVRHAATCVAGVAGCDADVSGNLYFQASRCSTDASRYVLSTTGHVLKKMDCVTPADKRRFVYNVYYVRDFSVTAGDGVPTLMRSQMGLNGTLGTPEPLVEGVEGFRIELGIDHVSDSGASIIVLSSNSDPYRDPISWADAGMTSPTNRGDGIPDEFLHCDGSSGCVEDNLVHVVAVKLHLLMRSNLSTPGYVDGKSYTLGDQTITAANDGFKRHVFSTVVRLNNVSARRETP